MCNNFLKYLVSKYGHEVTGVELHGPGGHSESQYTVSSTLALSHGPSRLTITENVTGHPEHLLGRGH